jgi:hypothetical protein
MKIAILKGDIGSPFDGDQYVVDLSRQFEGYQPGDLICQVHPFGPVYLPLQLKLAIHKDGSLGVWIIILQLVLSRLQNK